MITLTPEQCQVLANSREMPLAAIDPATNETYVLVQFAVYERFQHLFEDDTAPGKREVAMLVEQAMRDYDANDPTLDLYQQD